MKKILLVTGCVLLFISMFAQDQPKTETKKKIDLRDRANDHLLIQMGITNWAKRPDSIDTKGLSRSFNMYFMFDFPFKTSPHLSAALGIGLASDNIYFNKMNVGIKDVTPILYFKNVADTTHFKKYKLTTAYLEAPLELRYSSNPETPNKSFKVAVGFKAGTLLNAHTKGKTLESSTGGVLDPYTEKENSKHFFNANRFTGTLRVGYGVFSIYGSYQLNTLFKLGFAPDVTPYSIGFTLSGL